ncbi:MAG: hypothetical protein Q9223_002417 [Gallowayella weberi]
MAMQISGLYEESFALNLRLDAIFGPLTLLTPVSILRDIFTSKIAICAKQAVFLSSLLMAEAGFDPEAYVSMERKINKQSGLEPCKDPKAKAEKVVSDVPTGCQKLTNLPCSVLQFKWLSKMIPEVVAIVGDKVLPHNSAATDLDTIMVKQFNWEQFKKNRHKKTRAL